MSSNLSDEEVLKRKIDDLKTEGWSVSEESQTRAVMVKRNYGSLGMHIIVAALTVWWTLGLGNAAYAGWCYMKRSDKRVVRPDG